MGSPRERDRSATGITPDALPVSVCNQARLSHGDAGYWRSRRSGPATLCFPRNLANFLGLAKVTKGGRSGRPAGLTGPPVASPFLPGVPKPRGPGQKCPGATRRDFRQPVSGFNFCLWVWHAAEAPLEGRRDAPWTMAERLLRSPAVAPQWSLLPGKSDLGSCHALGSKWPASRAPRRTAGGAR